MSELIKFSVRLTFLLLMATVIAYLVPRINPEPVIVTKEVPVAMKTVDAKALAKELLTKQSYACLTKLLGKESAWDPAAKNPMSSARGIGQLLESTYDNLGMKHSSNEKAQLIATLAYIGRKYGNGGPCAAWDFFSKRGYY